MTIGKCDPRALEVARSLHRTEQPEVTVLFGSRARGDYDGHSDIDIMLVQENPPSKEQESRTRNQAEDIRPGTLPASGPGTDHLENVRRIQQDAPERQPSGGQRR